MLENLTQALSASKEKASEAIASAAADSSRHRPSSADADWVGHGARLRRAAKLPEFLLVPHAALRLRGLNPTDAITIAALAYRRRHGAELDAHTLSAWCGWSRWTSQRSLTKVLKAGLVGEDGQLVAERMPTVAGAIRLELKALREHGPIDALGVAQLRAWRELGIAKIKGPWFEVGAELLAKFLGCCEKTARRVLERLMSGRTLRIRRVLRGGAQVLVCGLLELQKALGRAPFVRLATLQRERAKDGEPAIAKGTSPEAKPPESKTVAYADTALEIAQALRTGQLRPSATPG